MNKAIILFSLLLPLNISLAKDCADATKIVGEVANESKGDFSKLAAKLQEAINICPELAEAHYQLGILDLENNKISDAIKNIKKSLEIKKEPLFQLALANAYVLVENLSEAEQVYNDILLTDSDSIKAIQGLSVVYIKQNKDAEAEDILRKAIQISSDEASLFYNLGVVLEKQGRNDEALESYKACLERKNPYPEAQIHLGMLLLKEDRYLEAGKLFKQASLLQPKNYLVWLGLSIVDESNRDYLGAISNVEKAMSISPESLEAKINHAVLLVKSGKVEEGNIKLKELESANPSNNKVLAAIGWSYLIKEEYKLAEDKIESAIKLNPEDAFSYNNLAIVYSKLGEKDKATAAMNKAKQLKPKNSNIDLNLENLK
ncbi:MAG: tetratricopeptide repeat protein [Proteobacteria bacterium]|nr:tetratricopeptide repeat protein [Pseudomonadota bacterium]